MGHEFCEFQFLGSPKSDFSIDTSESPTVFFEMTIADLEVQDQTLQVLTPRLKLWNYSFWKYHGKQPCHGDIIELSLHICIYTCIHIYIYIHIHVYIYIYIYIHIHVYIYITYTLYIYISIYIYVYVYVYVCIYIYTYVYTYR